MYSKGRGAISNRDSRYADSRIDYDDGAEVHAGDTECVKQTAKSIIARNSSPDVPFEQSINPYRGCEHGCIYCYARPTHAWLDLSPGQDFETRLTYKHNAAQLLEEELRKPGYRCSPITLGANTDPYQPVEKQHGISREILQVLQRHHHPFAIITKGNLILRDLDILADMASRGLCSVAVSVTTLDNDLKRAMEPRTPAGTERIKTIAALSDAGIPTSVLAAPMIPALNDKELEQILSAAADAGATAANYILLRLPLEITALFEEWLHQHYPLKAEHVMSVLRQCRGGRSNDPRFGHRMRGQGVFADMLETRFRVACRKLGLNRREQVELSNPFEQFSLFND